MKGQKATYLIIGNSVAAVGAVAGIRSLDTVGKITIVSREPHRTYSRPLISYLLGSEVSEEQMFYPQPSFCDENDVETLLGTEVERIDFGERVAVTADGPLLQFDRLLIATGGSPLVPDIPGSHAAGVFTLTTWDDAKRIKHYVSVYGVKEAVVVGGGLIGLKSVEALIALGIKATVVELAERILSVTFDKTASELAEEALTRAGVGILCNTTVSEVDQAAGKACGVLLRDGAKIPCQLVLFAIGVLPNTGIVAGTEIKVDRGIIVDDRMETSVKGIYAAGDVAQARDLLSGEWRLTPIFPDAYRQGYAAGRNMAGGYEPYAGGTMMNSVDICGLPTISVGMTSPAEDGYEILSSLNRTNRTYKKIVLRDNRIVGAIFIGDIDRAGIFTGLIKMGTSVTGFKNLLLTEDFGLISLPAEYRKHMVSGAGIEV